MRVKCTICDQRYTIDDWSFEAKRLRNKPVRVYLCDECRARITERTEARQKTGHFRLFPTWDLPRRRW